MDQKPASVPKADPRLLGFMIMGSFIFFQLVLLLILKFVVAPDHTPSIEGFLNSICTDVISKVFVMLALLILVLQQFLRSRFLEGDSVKYPQLIILLALAEVPGLLGFVGALLNNDNVSFALPLVVVSIVAFMTLKPIVLKLKN